MADRSHNTPVPPVPNLFAPQTQLHVPNGYRLPPIHGQQVSHQVAHTTHAPEPVMRDSSRGETSPPPPHSVPAAYHRHSAHPEHAQLALSNRAKAMWALVKTSKKRVITLLGGSDQRSSGKRKSNFGGFENLAFSQHGQGKITAKKKIVVYIQSADVFKGFDSWVDAMTFIHDEKQKDDTVRWWLDALEPPNFETCMAGIKSKTSDGKPRLIPSLIDVTGCDASAVKILCPWSLVRGWEREDNGKVDVEVFNTKTPRDQFSINDSFGDEIMLASFNMPIVVPANLKSVSHPVLAERAMSEKLSIGTSAVEADRTCDMPFIILRGKDFVVTYGWTPNSLSMKIRHEFVNVRAHAHSVGKSMADSALDEVFAKAFEISIAEIEDLVEFSTSTSDQMDADRKKFTTNEIRDEGGDQSSAKIFLHTVADNIAACNRLLRSLLPKKAVCTAVDQVEWPDYIGKSCRQRLESCVAVFQYLEEQAASNLEQMKSMQDGCLSMINLGLSSQGMDMNMIMQRFAVVTLIMAPLTLITGFFGMNVPIPGPSMNPDEHESNYVWFWCILAGCVACVLGMWIGFKYLKIWK